VLTEPTLLTAEAPSPVRSYQLVREGTRRLEDTNVDSPRLTAELLLAHVLGHDRSQLYRNPIRVVSPDDVVTFFALVDRRRSGEPLQYILGHVHFFDCILKICPGVFIPRPETEVLVEVVLGELRRIGPPWVLFDVGTGSGALAIALARHMVSGVVYASDVSAAALELAAQNAQVNRVHDRIVFLQGGGLDPYRDVQPPQAIVSNPPYVRTDEWHTLSPEIREYEPRQALDGGVDGLDLIRDLIDDGVDRLQPEGFLAMEVDPRQVPAVLNIAENVVRPVVGSVVADLAGHPRVVLLKVSG
jgi:release factor glutamine methyltransferase